MSGTWWPYVRVVVEAETPDYTQLVIQAPGSSDRQPKMKTHPGHVHKDFVVQQQLLLVLLVVLVPRMVLGVDTGGTVNVSHLNDNLLYKQSW